MTRMGNAKPVGSTDTSQGGISSSSRTQKSLTDIVVEADQESERLLGEALSAEGDDLVAKLIDAKAAARRGTVAMDTLSGMHALHMRTLDTIIGNMKA